MAHQAGRFPEPNAPLRLGVKHNIIALERPLNQGALRERSDAESPRRVADTVY